MSGPGPAGDPRPGRPQAHVIPQESALVDPTGAPRINCGTEPLRGDIGLPRPATGPSPRAWDPLLGRGSCRPSGPAYADWSGGLRWWAVKRADSSRWIRV